MALFVLFMVVWIMAIGWQLNNMWRAWCRLRALRRNVWDD